MSFPVDYFYDLTKILPCEDHLKQLFEASQEYGIISSHFFKILPYKPNQSTDGYLTEFLHIYYKNKKEGSYILEQSIKWFSDAYLERMKKDFSKRNNNYQGDYPLWMVWCYHLLQYDLYLYYQRYEPISIISTEKIDELEEGNRNYNKIIVEQGKQQSAVEKNHLNREKLIHYETIQKKWTRLLQQDSELSFKMKIMDKRLLFIRGVTLTKKECQQLQDQYLLKEVRSLSALEQINSAIFESVDIVIFSTSQAKHPVYESAKKASSEFFHSTKTNIELVMREFKDYYITSYN